MATYEWPADLPPFSQSFYLQAHSGGSESPFSRTTKTYGLSAPRWVTRMQFRGGYNGIAEHAAFGPRLDAFLAGLNGREHGVILWDFRREGDDEAWTSSSADAGSTTITLTGGAPNVGWYLGGDGRPHIVRSVEESVGSHVVTVTPPFARDIASNEAFFGRPWGYFKLTSDDAGSNGATVGETVVYDLELVEDLTGPGIDGTPTALEILSVAGDWETFQWYVDGAPVDGATGSSFELSPGEAGKVITALVGLNRGGAIFTAPVGPVSNYDFSEYFSGGQTGGWWDVHPEHCWKDTAGTQPAAVGDAVARLDDRSGNGNHLLQADSGKRPILRQHVAPFLGYYLEFDGADDHLEATFTCDQPFDRISCIWPVAWGSGDNLLGTPGANGVRLIQSGSSPLVTMFAGSSLTAATSLPTGAVNIVHERYSTTASRLRVYPNPPEWLSPGSNNAAGLTIAYNTGTSSAAAQMNFYGAMVRSGSLSDIEVDRYASFLRSRRPLDAADYAKDYFGWNGLTMPWYSRATFPSARYNPLTDKTWFSWEGGRSTSNVRQLYVNVYDHTRGTWSGQYFVGTGGLTDDDHGVPSLEFLPDGRVLLMGGAHNTAMMSWISTNPDDPSAWTAQPDIEDYWTYPHPNLIGGTVHLFMRYTPDGNINGGDEDLDLRLLKSTAIDGTSITWSAATSVLGFGTASRTYLLRAERIGTEIHMIVQKANLASTTRENAYFLIYDSVTGDFHNLARDHTAASGTLPIDTTEADAEFRIVATTPGGYDHADFCYDGEDPDLLHVVCSDGGDWIYTRFTNGVAGTPVALDAQNGGYHVAVVQRTGGGAEVYYSEDDAAAWVNGGNIRRVVIDEAGTIGAPELIQTPPGVDFLYQTAAVGDAHPDAKVVWCEAEQDQSNERGTLRLYCYGENGFLKRRYA